MKRISIIILLFYQIIVSAQTKKIRFVDGNHLSENKSGWIKQDSGKVTREILRYRGSCCDSPVPKLINAEITNDTLYIDEAIQKHSEHDKIGFCGGIINVIIDSVDYPNYKKLVIIFKELKSTNNRKVPHIKR